MKNLKNITDRKFAYRIDAARLSAEISELTYEELEGMLVDYEINGGNFLKATLILRNLWAIIDNWYRFSTVVTQVKDLKHKDPRFKALENSFKIISKARNFIQHLNSGIPSLGKEIYPIMGVLSWLTVDKMKSYSIALGSMPNGTKIHTLSYDRINKIFLGDLILNYDIYEIKFAEIRKTIIAAHQYLNEWLETMNYLDTTDLTPTEIISGPQEGILIDHPYTRFQISFTNEQKYI